MSFSNLTLMRESRSYLAPHWGLGVLTVFVFTLFVGALPDVFPSMGETVSFILSGPFALGMSFFSLSIVKKETPHINQLFEGFQSFGKSFLAYLCFAILFLVGIVLLIIPGIVVAMGFSMTFYVMADQPELSFSECLHESWKITKGYRLKYFGLCLRFIPWYLLGALCLGIGVLVVLPWHYAANAQFYMQIKNAPPMGKEN